MHAVRRLSDNGFAESISHAASYPLSKPARLDRMKLKESQVIFDV